MDSDRFRSLLWPVVVALAVATAALALAHPVAGVTLPVLLTAGWLVPALTAGARADTPEGWLFMFFVVLIGAIAEVVAILAAGVHVFRALGDSEHGRTRHEDFGAAPS